MTRKDSDSNGASDGERLTGAAVDRRALVKSALGTAGALALAGCSSSASETDTPEDDGGEMDGTATPMGSPTPTEAMSGDSGEDVHPRFGFTATDPETEPPVEPDHTVDLVIEVVEGREIPEFYFEPTGLFVEPGDTVRFDLVTPHHNVNAYHPGFGYRQRVPEGVPPFSSQILTAGSYWLYTFEAEGVYDYVCAPHEYFGMAGRVVAGSATGPAANPVGEAPAPMEEARSPAFTAGLVLSDDAVAPERIVEQGSVSWGDLADESKRLTLVPAEE